jgi:biopolymer transport protein ExbB
MQNQNLGFMHFWQAGDIVTHGIAYLLLAMSLITWYLIISRGLRLFRLRRHSRKAVSSFWEQIGTGELNTETVQQLAQADANGPFHALAKSALTTAALTTAAPRTPRDVSDGLSNTSERITRSLRTTMNRQAAKLESGLTILASIGSVSPFVGLFGTVWGIYHALLNIAGAGQVLIDKVAGPVGEALIMTAAGLAVAIPAVLAYNAFVRANRVTLAELDGFAHDLHALTSH